MTRQEAKKLALGPCIGQTWVHQRHGLVRLVKEYTDVFIADILNEKDRREPVWKSFLVRKAGT